MAKNDILARGGRAVLLPPDVLARVDSLAEELGLYRASGKRAGEPDRVALVELLAEVGRRPETLAAARRIKRVRESAPPMVYVACASTDIELAEQAIARLRELGCRVTYDWTPDVRAMGSAPADPAKARRAMEADIRGVAEAECLLIIDGAASYGRTVELGAGIMRALHDGLPIVQWGTGGDLTRRRIWEEADIERHVHLADACEVARARAAAYRAGASHAAAGRHSRGGPSRAESPVTGQSSPAMDQWRS